MGAGILLLSGLILWIIWSLGLGLGLGFWELGSHGLKEMWWWVGGFGKCLWCCWDENENWDDAGNVGWAARFVGGGGGANIIEFFAESLALSSASASQNALWVMKLSFLYIFKQKYWHQSGYIKKKL